MNLLQFYSKHKLSIIIIILCAIMAGFNGSVNAYLTKVIIDRLGATENSDLIVSALLWPCIFIVISFEFHNLCWRALNYINLKITPIIKTDITNHCFSYIHKQSYHYFQSHLSGSIANNIKILADNIERVNFPLAPGIIRGVVQLFVAVYSMFYVHPIFSIALFIWAVTFLTVSSIYSKRIRIYSDNYAKTQSLVAGKLVDSFANIGVVKIFSRIDYELSYLGRVMLLMNKAFQNKEWFFIKFYLVQGLSITCLMGFMITMLIKLKIQGVVTIGDFAFVLGSSLYVTDHIWWVTEQLNELNDVIGRCRQSINAIFIPLEIEDKVDAKSLQVPQGEIIFDKVQFNYKGDTPLFQDKSVTIKAKEKVGLVGYSGSGKSTFINLILRLYEVNSGKILIDGQNIQEVTQDSLRSAIGVIAQDPTLFHRSLMDNIRYGKIDANDAEVMSAAKKAHVDHVIAKLPAGYHTIVGEQGIKLSGGERQRIAIARVFLKNAPIIVLDEATSQLDATTEGFIQDSLQEVMQNKTTLVIAHRLSTLLHMDRILVFSQGKIVEEGSHAQLIEQKGLYQELWSKQVNGFLPKDKEK